MASVYDMFPQQMLQYSQSLMQSGMPSAKPSGIGMPSMRVPQMGAQKPPSQIPPDDPLLRGLPYGVAPPTPQPQPAVPPMPPSVTIGNAPGDPDSIRKAQLAQLFGQAAPWAASFGGFGDQNR